MILFLSGPITGVENYRDTFKLAALELKRQGYQVINPAELCEVMGPDMDHEDYMKICEALLDMADGVVQLPGWRGSLGANREYGYALGRDLTIFDYDEMKGRWG